MGAIINKHNSKILNASKDSFKCKCQNKKSYPLPGKCTIDKVVYRATVSSGNYVETYVGLTAGPFKNLFHKHCSDFVIQKKTLKKALYTFLEAEGRKQAIQNRMGSCDNRFTILTSVQKMQPLYSRKI